MKLIRPIITLLAATTTLAAAALSDNFFPESSVLASGRWVKVTTADAGIYQITFDQLREMGFADPEKVSVFGHGAKPMGIQFLSNYGQPLIDPDLSQVAVKYLDDRILFYAQGNTTVTWNAGSNGYFARSARNVYSDTGAYLLTDSAEPRAITVNPALTDDMLESIDVPDAEYLTAYYLNEKDLLHGNRGSGQIFWERAINTASPSASWNAPLPFGIAGSPATLEGCFHASNEGSDAKLTVAVDGIDASATFNFASSSSVYFQNSFKTPLRFDLPSKNPKFLFSINCTNSAKAANLQGYLDWWLLTYRMSIPAGSGAPVRDVVLAAESTTAGTMRISKPTSYQALEVWNIDNPAAPVIGLSGNASAVVAYQAGGSRISMFDPSRQQQTISAWQPVANVNLQSLKEIRPQMLVITTSEFEPYARQLADLHQRTDGVVVAVANVTDIYNQFSGGIPDPMAYRTLIKMLYIASDSRLENVLLFGPLLANVRGIATGNTPDPDKYIIAYQNHNTTIASDTHNINDYLVTLDDILPNSPDSYNITLGIGILPVRSEKDALTQLEKIERYITDTDYAHIATRIAGLSGPGDQNLHTSQISDLMDRWDTYLLGTSTPQRIVFDAIPDGQVPATFKDALDDGRMISLYMGHSSARGLHNSVLTKGNLHDAANHNLTFIFTGSCDITDPDHQIRGLGESLVMDFDNLAVAGIMSTRTAWSSHNETFMKNFLNTLVNGSTNVRRDTPISLGRAFANAKTTMRSQHEHTFQLFGDPSLILPVPLYSADVADYTQQAAPGSDVTFSGEVLSHKGGILNTFNGEAEVEIMAPTYSITSQNFLSGSSEPQPIIANRHTVISSARVEVKDGAFSGRISIPSTAVIKDADVLTLHLTAVDPETRLVATAALPITVDSSVAPSPAEADNRAPLIEAVDYDGQGALTVIISDNKGISLSSRALMPATTVAIDGKDCGSLTPYVQWLSYTEPRVMLTLPATLANGMHSIAVNAVDINGNAATRTFSLELGNTPRYTLEGKRVQSGVARFSIQGSSPSDAGDIIISDLSGNILRKGAFVGSAAAVTLTGLQPGLVQVALRSADAPDAYSLPFTFAIVEGAAQ